MSKAMGPPLVWMVTRVRPPLPNTPNIVTRRSSPMIELRAIVCVFIGRWMMTASSVTRTEPRPIIFCSKSTVIVSLPLSVKQLDGGCAPYDNRRVKRRCRQDPSPTTRRSSRWPRSSAASLCAHLFGQELPDTLTPEEAEALPDDWFGEVMDADPSPEE